MAVIVTMVILCAAAVAFCLRFLMALSEERERSWICYLVRLEPSPRGKRAVDSLEKKHSVARAA